MAWGNKKWRHLFSCPLARLWMMPQRKSGPLILTVTLRLSELCGETNNGLRSVWVMLLADSDFWYVFHMFRPLPYIPGSLSHPMQPGHVFFFHYFDLLKHDWIGVKQKSEYLWPHSYQLLDRWLRKHIVQLYSWYFSRFKGINQRKRPNRDDGYSPGLLMMTCTTASHLTTKV